MRNETVVLKFNMPKLGEKGTKYGAAAIKNSGS